MNSSISDPAFWSRFRFGITLTYYYLFPQLTMGLIGHFASYTAPGRSNVASRPNVYKLERSFEVKKEIRIRSVTLCEVPTVAGLEQT